MNFDWICVGLSRWEAFVGDEHYMVMMGRRDEEFGWIAGVNRRWSRRLFADVDEAKSYAERIYHNRQKTRRQLNVVARVWARIFGGLI